MSTDRLRWLLLGVAAIVLVVHSLAYNFVTDDAYISFVFSRNFAEHGQLSFNLGQPVEGYTNFLWTILLGILMLVGISPEISSRVLGTACALVTLYIVFTATERALERRTPIATIGALLLACSSGFACWTSGGLETQLFTMLVVIALDGKSIKRTAIALALAAMTRPEGLLVAAVIGVAYLGNNLLEKKKIARDDLIAAALFLVIWAPWFAWRWHYYGYKFPNTYYVKASGPWVDPKMATQMAETGRYYIWRWLVQAHVLWAAPLILAAFYKLKPRTPRFRLVTTTTLLAIVYVVYAMSVGGDFMGLHRFIMPVFACVAILVAIGLDQLPYKAPIAAIAIALFAVTQLQLTRDSIASCAGRTCNNDHGIDSPAFLMVYTEDRAAIGRAMADCFKPDDFSIVGGAGAQPYFGRMRGIDVFGLVSEKIAHDSPRSNPRPGHTKWGSDTILASYDPTFVFSCYQIHYGPMAPPLPCNTGFWTSRGFEEVTMFIPDLAERGQYYTFLAKKDRHFQCPGRVR
ncbi:MAG: hypothetical protein QM831_07660 [Kofleriaceae bacterium]